MGKYGDWYSERCRERKEPIDYHAESDDGPCLICGKPWHSGHTAEERKACDDAL